MIQREIPSSSSEIGELIQEINLNEAFMEKDPRFLK